MCEEHQQQQRSSYNASGWTLPCHFQTLSLMNCKSRAEAFAKSLHSKLKSLGRLTDDDQDGEEEDGREKPADEIPPSSSPRRRRRPTHDEKSRLLMSAQNRENSSSLAASQHGEDELYFDFDIVSSPESPAESENRESARKSADKSAVTTQPICRSNAHDSEPERRMELERSERPPHALHACSCSNLEFTNSNFLRQNLDGGINNGDEESGCMSAVSSVLTEQDNDEDDDEIEGERIFDFCDFTDAAWSPPVVAGLQMPGSPTSLLPPADCYYYPGGCPPSPFRLLGTIVEQTTLEAAESETTTGCYCVADELDQGHRCQCDAEAEVRLYDAQNVDRLDQPESYMLNEGEPVGGQVQRQSDPRQHFVLDTYHQPHQEPDWPWRPVSPKKPVSDSRESDLETQPDLQRGSDSYQTQDSNLPKKPAADSRESDLEKLPDLRRGSDSYQTQDSDLPKKPAADSRESDLATQPDIQRGSDSYQTQDSDFPKKPAADSRESDLETQPDHQRGSDSYQTQDSDLPKKPASDAGDSDLPKKPVADSRESDLKSQPDHQRGSDSYQTRDSDLPKQPWSDARDSDLPKKPVSDSRESDLKSQPDLREGSDSYQTQDSDLLKQPSSDARDSDLPKKPVSDSQELDLKSQPDLQQLKSDSCLVPDSLQRDSESQQRLVDSRVGNTVLGAQGPTSCQWRHDEPNQGERGVSDDVPPGEDAERGGPESQETARSDCISAPRASPNLRESDPSPDVEVSSDDSSCRVSECPPPPCLQDSSRELVTKTEKTEGSECWMPSSLNVLEFLSPDAENGERDTLCQVCVSPPPCSLDLGESPVREQFVFGADAVSRLTVDVGLSPASAGSDEDGALLSPTPDDDFPRRVRRSSSLKTCKTPPGTPNRKKIVRFADALGLDLEAVKTVFLDDLPTVPSSAFVDLQDVDDGDESQLPEAGLTVYNSNLAGFPSFQPLKAGRNLVPVFPQPASLADFIDRVRRQSVCLESAVLAGESSVRLVIRVLNLDFDKYVAVRYTVDEWATVTNAVAEYVQGSHDGFSDKFATVISADDVRVGDRLAFAIQYVTQGREFWDNNYGQNYCFQCFLEQQYQPSPSDDSWVHFL